MVLYYAMGGGLGHLVRARAVLHTLGLEGRATLLTASRHAGDPRVVGALPVVAPPEALRGEPASVARWAVGAIGELAPDELFIDAFPSGLFGELRDLKPGPALTYVARLLDWSAYRPLVQEGPWRFSRTWVVEDLHREHQTFVDGRSDHVERLTLVDPPVAPARLPELPARHTLVVHAGPDDELAELVAYARALEVRDPSGEAGPSPIVVCRPGAARPSVEGTVSVDVHPAVPLFAAATRIVSAGGFNAIRQTADHAAKHHALPFPRRYDDQFTRTARARLARAAAGVSLKGASI